MPYKEAINFCVVFCLSQNKSSSTKTLYMKMRFICTKMNSRRNTFPYERFCANTHFADTKAIIKCYKRCNDIWLACLIQTLLVKTWFFSSWKTDMKTEMIQFEYHSTKQNQEIIKVKEWIFHMGPDMGLISKVIPLKLHGTQFFRVSRVAWIFSWRTCFKAKETEPPTQWGCLWLQAS